MADYSLVPVDHQPDFSDVSLVPVDHDPFSADDVVQQAQTQPAQNLTKSPPQQPATGPTLPAVGAPTDNPQAATPGESYDPDSEPSNGVPVSSPLHNTSAAPISHPYSADDWARSHGELKATTYAPTQRIGNLAADTLTGLGMQPYTANDLASRLGNLLGLTSLGVVGSGLDLIDAKRRDDLPGVLAARPE